MKKVLTGFLVLAMMVSVFAGFAVTASAAPEYLETEYKYDVSAEWGNEETKDNPVFGGGLWMYEWYHEVEEKFGIMEAWFDKTPEGVGSSAMTNFYTAIENSYEEYGGGAGTLDDYYFCAIRYNGKGMHPGINVAAVITFVCPADGKLQYTVAGLPNGANNVEEKDSTGNHLYVFLDEEIVYEVEACYYNAEKDPYKVDLILDVKEGQKIRYAIGPNGKRSSKGWDLKELPSVVYMESPVPIGDPKGACPENIMTTDRTSDGCTVSWDAVENATGYNVYLDGKKLNSEPITATNYTITGLEPETVYESLTVSSVSAAGVESDQSEPKSFRTKQADAETPAGSDNAPSGDDKTPATPDADKDNEGNQDDKAPSTSGTLSVGLIIGIVVAVVVVLAILIVAIVLVVMMMKKMQALAAPQAPAAPPVEEKPEVEGENKNE